MAIVLDFDSRSSLVSVLVFCSDSMQRFKLVSDRVESMLTVSQVSSLSMAANWHLADSLVASCSADLAANYSTLATNKHYSMY